MRNSVPPLKETLLELADEEEANAKAHEQAGSEELRRWAQHERRIAAAARGLAEGMAF